MAGQQQPALEDVELLARLVRETREHPERFARGTRFLGERFTFDAIIASREKKLRSDITEAEAANRSAIRREKTHAILAVRREGGANKIDQRETNRLARKKAKTAGKGEIPILGFLRDKLAQGVTEFERREGRIVLPRNETIAWASNQTWLMGRAEAEAVCLVAVTLYDDDPNPNPALPDCLRAIPWGEPETAKDDHEVLRGRWIHAQFRGVSPELMKATRLAIARMMSRGQPQADPSSIEGRAAGERGTASARRIAHGADFTWLSVAGTKFSFHPGQQAGVIRCLFAEWERANCVDGCGVHEKVLGEKVESSSDRFRIEKLFSKHEAKGTILCTTGKGMWALFLNEPQSRATESPEKGHVKGQMAGQVVRHNRGHAGRTDSRGPAGDGAKAPRPGEMAPRRGRR